MSKTMLTELYTALDFQTESLLTASEVPYPELSMDDWLDKGEWLAAAKRAGADKLFFVGHNPVVVFAECGSGNFEKERAFNRIWCLGRPRLLFLASPGELTVLDLAQKPVYRAGDINTALKRQARLSTLDIVNETENVAQTLNAYHRDKVESGVIFTEGRFGDMKHRADKALIRDLRTVRSELIHAGLSGHKLKYAHALIGRSIFIRYLEDRGVITREYILAQTEQFPEWVDILERAPNLTGVDLSERTSNYSRVLENKEFTYALFRALARDFNGDMFLDIDEEEEVVTQAHLQLVQELFYGYVGIQRRLFFYSYNFDIVPLELISSIYEEFYDSSAEDEKKQSKARMDGAYYTPPALAEFTVSRVLTEKELAKHPRVLDPACGSGVFLVEAFRRMVRFEWHLQKKRLDFNTLKRILRDQIAGIEVNEEAARITAFSLFLALLHYLSPPAITEQIKQGNRLPNLLATENSSNNHYHCILIENAFDITKVESNPLWVSRFGSGCADIIVSNPPWGSLDTSKSPELSERNSIVLQWCRDNNKPIGDNEASQAFLWRFLDFLRDEGKAAVLVSAGVLFKYAGTSKEFRKQWMKNVQLYEVFNFIHVISSFFKKSSSPFLLLAFAKGEQRKAPIMYWSAKRTAPLRETQAVSLCKYDVNVIRDEDISSNELWKTYWFGRFQDRQLIMWLQSKERLETFVDKRNSGRGFQLGKRDKDAKELRSLEALMIMESRYKPPSFTKPPQRVHRLGKIGAYNGMRVLVKVGFAEKGIIIAQFHSEPFCFYRRSYGIKLKNQSEESHKVLTGILWSSLARYYFFMTSAYWGIWHYHLLSEEVLNLPVHFSNEHPATEKIINVVDKLRNYQPIIKAIDHVDGTDENEVAKQRRQWECELDDAVFELYDLSEEQKDLVRDFCDVTLPFFYEPISGDSSKPAVVETDASWLMENYIGTFSRRWKAYLSANMEMRAQLHVGAHGTVIAVEFYPADKEDVWILNVNDDSWKFVLDQLEKSLRYPIGTTQIILDGMVHAVSDDSVIIIKRNERRFWTSSLAREDADVTLHKRMTNPLAEDGGER